MQSNFFQGETGRCGLLPAPSALSPVGIAAALLAGPLRTASLFAVVLWDLWAQVSLAFRARCLGVHPSGGAVDTEALDVWSKLSPLGEAGSWGFHPDCMGLSPGVGWWLEMISAFPNHFDIHIFFFAPWVGVPQLISGFSQRELYISCVHGKRDIQDVLMLQSWSRVQLVFFWVNSDLGLWLADWVDNNTVKCITSRAPLWTCSC